MSICNSDECPGLGQFAGRRAEPDRGRGDQDQQAATVGDPKLAAGAAAKQAEEHFEVITFSDADAEVFVQASRDAGWAGVAEINAEFAEKLRPLFSH